LAARIQIGNRFLDGVALAIFDKDGTLIDVHHYWSRMVQLRADLIAEQLNLDRDDRNGLMDSMGVRVDAMKIKPEGPVGLKKREIVQQAGVDYLIKNGHSDHTALFVEVFAEVDRLSMKRLNEMIKPLPGLFEMATALKQYGTKLAVATTDRTEHAILAMDHLGLGGVIECIVGADQVSNPKPHPEVVHAICNRMKMRVQTTIMVGDSKSDVMAGIQAGCLASIGVASGLTPEDELHALTPYVARDISGIAISASD